MRAQLFCCSLQFSAKSRQRKKLWKTANRVLKNFQKVKRGHKLVHCSKYRSLLWYWNWLQIWVALILFSSALLPWNACKLPFTENICDIQADNLHSSIQKFAVSFFFFPFSPAVRHSVMFFLCWELTQSTLAGSVHKGMLIFSNSVIPQLNNSMIIINLWVYCWKI